MPPLTSAMANVDVIFQLVLSTKLGLATTPRSRKAGTRAFN
jgi:hypothetical protein